MHSYCLYYYKKAQVRTNHLFVYMCDKSAVCLHFQELRPNDSRMLMALGDSYEKLERLDDALKCYWKAHCLGKNQSPCLFTCFTNQLFVYIF